ncbi:hypothetical protein [Aquabacter cavernae]|uniref:hypothetical protein n=1 Tax=Aquabacter cavernae TaxID=2496029 RepID=UPI000F8CCDF3|nr:hypothetical protein [Aquabacter cavernae]
MRLASAALPILALAAVSLTTLAIPASAEDTPMSVPAPRQPSGALVPDPLATPGSSRQGGATLETDPNTTGTIRSRDTKGLPQSPENLNVLGCKQIDPLCQGEPRR